MISIAEQVRAIANERTNPRKPLNAFVPDRPVAPTPKREPRRDYNAVRIARANRYRALTLDAMARCSGLCVPDLVAMHPGVAQQSWAWVMQTMKECGHVEFHKTGARNTKYYRITDAGRAELSRLAEHLTQGESRNE